jgi:hypothetical protein
VGVRTTIAVLALTPAVVLGSAASERGAPPRDRDVLSRAGAIVLRYEEELPRLVARETTVQRIRGRGLDEPNRERDLVAEFGWVAVPGSEDVVGVRDVVEVDGQALTNERDRLQTLLHETPRASSADVRRLLDEAARYNLNLLEGSRNLNLPTLVLFYLHPRAQSHFRWSRRSPPTAAVWEFEFAEKDWPTYIHAGADGRTPVVSRGRVLIEPMTGTIRRSELNLRFRGVKYTLITIFERVASLDLILPASLEERYETSDNSLAGKATYDNYRRFETDARILP